MDIGAFIEKWRGVKGGQERANYGQFINDFCQALTLPLPQPAAAGVLGDYQFEGPVQGGGAGGNTGAIDLYKKGHFILEAKQSKLSDAQRQQAELFDAAEDAPVSPSGARYDRLMRDALAQAKRYAVNLPSNHPWPPFLIVCDVGRAFELYFDYSGNGRGYGYFPDQHSYRFEINRFSETEVQEIFRAIWINPASIDPRAKSAEVSRRIATKLAEISQWLEKSRLADKTDVTDMARSLAIEDTALFLMRIVFCLFAEDVGLLPKDRFTDFLKGSVDFGRGDQQYTVVKVHDEYLSLGLQRIWKQMDSALESDRYSMEMKSSVRHFNGGLFARHGTFALGSREMQLLIEAAEANWTKVEPAIFGTLLEQALTASERSKLGAHYTPRPYVERLVQATIMDVLEAEWEAITNPSPLAGEGGAPTGAEGEGEGALATQQIIAAQTRRAPSPNPLPQGEREVSLDAVSAFHTRLSTLRILDPACGTGNFLYVAMENLMRLEGDVIETIRQLGGTAEPLVGPQQFLGLELNPRAAVIAELVLWIGWLRWRMKNDPDAAPDPVLKQYGNINFGGHAGYDAVLCHKPTGEADTDTPMMPDWPEADFIIGNPPFIGSKYLRELLGSDYAEALWKANSRVSKSADFVMQWWDRAAHILVADDTSLIRFGFVTTNSITQTFSRRVIEGYLNKNPSPLAGEGGAPSGAEGEGASAGAKNKAAQTRRDPSPDPSGHPLPQGERGLSLILAIADHPWTKATKDAAAIRIAMTVAEAGASYGKLLEVVGEERLTTDDPIVSTIEFEGTINSDLTIGTNSTKIAPLQSNQGLSARGVGLFGDKFLVTVSKASHLGLGKRAGLESVFRLHRNGRDLVQTQRSFLAIDLFGFSEKEVRVQFPELYQYVLEHLKPHREHNRRPSRRDNWWLFGEQAPLFRQHSAGLGRYLVTPVTSKHRIFVFLDAGVLPDDALVTIGLEDDASLGILSSSIHDAWTFHVGGALGNAPRYTKADCFDPFPFPDVTPAQRTAIAELAEELDETRKAALAEVPGLTMTEIYNLRAKLNSGVAMDLVEQDRATKARAGIVNRLHEQIDAAVADAYGWPADLTPSEIVTRLVALNAERAKEEAEGNIRWLRPDYQIPRFGTKKAEKK